MRPHTVSGGCEAAMVDVVEMIGCNVANVCSVFNLLLTLVTIIEVHRFVFARFYDLVA